MSGRGRKRKYLNAAESAEAKKARDRARQARLVDVGDERQRWSQLAAQAGCTRDCDFAKLLLDSPPVYKARTLLAALDFHLHADRELKTDAQGNTVYRRMYNKRTKSWFAIKMREPKSYHYITDLQRKVLETRESVPGPLKQKAQLSATDPRRISSTLAMEDPPALSVLLERHVSRGGSSQSQP